MKGGKSLNFDNAVAESVIDPYRKSHCTINIRF